MILEKDKGLGISYMRVIGENARTIIKYCDSISYEFYLVHGLFVSGGTAIVGLWGRSLWEIPVTLIFSIVFSELLHRVCDFLKRKGRYK